MENAHYFKHPIDMENGDIDEILISGRVYFCKKGSKYFIECKDDKNIRSLYTIIPKMSGYLKHFDKTKYISIFIKDDELLKNIIKPGIMLASRVLNY